MRLDLYLDRVCVFKTRSAAAKAIDAGSVTIDGATAKRSQSVSVGQIIDLRSSTTMGERHRRLRVIAVPSGSVSKRDASTYYEEVPVDGVAT